MPRTDTHPAPARHVVAMPQLLFGLFGAPVAWAVQLLSATAVNSFGCIAGLDENTPTGLQAGSATWIALLVLTLLLILVSGAALVTALRSWRKVHEPSEPEEAELLETGEGRARFMAMGGILLGSIFSLLLVLNSLPIFFSAQCVQP